MRYKIWFISLLWAVLVAVHCNPLFAQKKKSKKQEQQQVVDDRISTRMNSSDQIGDKKKVINYKEVKKSKQTKGKTSVKPLTPQNNFVEKVTWKRQVAYNEAREDPTFFDAMYFGHKKKPKKNPPGKRKLCKECQMVH